MDFFFSIKIIKVEMRFRQLDFQRFDEAGNYALNEEYILSY